MSRDTLLQKTRVCLHIAHDEYLVAEIVYLSLSFGALPCQLKAMHYQQVGN